MGSKFPQPAPKGERAIVKSPAPPLPHETMAEYQERTHFQPVTLKMTPWVYRGRVSWLEDEPPMIGEGI